MKQNTIIKVLSLGFGLAIGIVLIGKIFYELAYDRGYKDVDRIYRIISSFTRDDVSGDYNQVSGGVAPGFRAEVPGVEAATRYTPYYYSGERFKDDKGNVVTGSSFVADSCFFDVFQTHILAGNPKEVLGMSDQIMVSESFANKLGGVSEVVGKNVTIDKDTENSFMIGGVYKDFNRNGSIQTDVIFSMEVLPPASTENWVGNDMYRGFVKLAPNVDAKSLSESIAKMQRNHVDVDRLAENGIILEYYLANFSDLHLQNPKVKGTVIILSIVAILLLLVSVLNYVLVVVSDLVKRSREIGVRKCYGASQRDIFGLLTKEGVIQLCLGLTLAGVIIYLGKGLIKEFTGYSFMEMLVPLSILAIAIVVVLILLISIYVPAKIYQRMSIDKSLRNFTDHSRRWKIGLLSVQMFINVFIISFILIVALQYRKVVNLNPGYDTENILFFDVFIDSNEEIGLIMDRLGKMEDVEHVGAVMSLPYIGASGNYVSIPGEESTRFNIVDLYPATTGAFDLFNLKFIDGFKPSIGNEIAVSKSLVDKMKMLTDWNDGAVGKEIYLTGHDGSNFIISGVYEDIQIGGYLDPETRPSAWPFGSIDNPGDIFGKVVVKVNEITPGSTQNIQNMLDNLFPDKRHDIRIYREAMSNIYAESLKIRNILITGVVFSLIIALMGLIGFLRDESNRRSKELAIRKINGASSVDILGIFYMSIVKLSVATAVIASVGAYFVGSKWLEQFSEKITLSPLIFILASLTLIVVMTIVVMVNCWKLSFSNPADTLRSE